MKILIVNTSDIQGGAARAAYRLHRSLLEQGIDSQMLVQSKKSDDYTVLTKSESKIQKLISKIRSNLDFWPVKKYKNRTKTLFSPAWLPFSNIVKKINAMNPDIVHLHWICGGFIRIEDIVKIKAPVVWSLHDMWAFTGGCHYNEGCEKYKTNCGCCKVLESSKKKDLSKKVFDRKKKYLIQKKDITIIGLSRWLNDCSKGSFLLKNKKHANLPNPINTNLFKPFDKEKSRELWNLPNDKKLVLFGAMKATDDPRKGFNELDEAFKNLEKKQDVEFVVFGSSKPKIAPDFGVKTHYLGNLHDDVSLVTLYSAVDVMVVPSLQENLSNAIMESMSCGTPVVAFSIGGNSDMIDHCINGYLAQPYNAKDLAEGIKWVLNNQHDLSKNARKKIIENFNFEFVANQYVKLYSEILKSKENI